MPDWAGRLRAIRLAHDWTQAECSRQLGLAPSTVSHIERTKKRGRAPLRSIRAIIERAEAALQPVAGAAEVPRLRFSTHRVGTLDDGLWDEALFQSILSVHRGDVLVRAVEGHGRTEELARWSAVRALRGAAPARG